jgi:hypothetical protein
MLDVEWNTTMQLNNYEVKSFEAIQQQTYSGGGFQILMLGG